MKQNLEFHFHPCAFRPLSKITKRVQVRTGMNWTWYMHAWKVVDLDTGKILKEKITKATESPVKNI